jgi:hypothetical protein
VTDLDGVTTGKHTGIGASIDQRIGDGSICLVRYGQADQG